MSRAILAFGGGLTGDRSSSSHWTICCYPICMMHPDPANCYCSTALNEQKPMWCSDYSFGLGSRRLRVKSHSKMEAHWVTSKASISLTCQLGDALGSNCGRWHCIVLHNSARLLLGRCCQEQRKR